MASGTPAAPSSSRISACSRVSTQRTTSAMSRSPNAAAKSSGRQHLGRGGVPEVTVGHGADRGLGHLGQAGGRPPGAGPGAGGRQRGPPGGLESGGAGRVEAPDLSDRPAEPEGVVDQVGLDAGGDHRALPPQDGRDGEARGLVRLGGPEDDDRLGRLGRHQVAAQPAEDQAPGQRRPGDRSAPYHQRAQVLRAGPTGRHRRRGPVRPPGGPDRGGTRRPGGGGGRRVPKWGPPGRGRPAKSRCGPSRAAPRKAARPMPVTSTSPGLITLHPVKAPPGRRRCGPVIEHGLVGVGEPQLLGGQAVLDQERAPAHLPEGGPPSAVG